MIVDKEVEFYYRVMEIDDNNHSFVVRYWTDNISEDFLATYHDNEGNIVRNEKGQPIRCSTDYNITLYDYPNPSKEELEKIILDNVNVFWFYTKNQILSSNSDYSLSNVYSVLGTTTKASKMVTPAVPQNEFSLETLSKALTMVFPGKELTLTVKSEE